METRDPESVVESSSNSLEENGFRMLAVYDSLQSSADAARVSELISRELGKDVSIRETAWDIEDFQEDFLRARVADEAAKADVIVVALAGDSPSPELKEWVSQWQARRENEGGLLALIPSDDSEAGSDLATFLYETAVSAQMDFLCRKKPRF